MAITFACPKCGKSHAVREVFAGRRAKCSGCSEILVVPAAAAPAPAIKSVAAAPRQPAPPQAAPPARSASQPPGNRHQGGTIQSDNPYATFSTVAAQPGLQRGDSLWRDGNLLVMTKNAELPPRCVKTNEPTDSSLRRKLYWHNPLLYLLIIFPGLLIYLIVALIVRESADIRVGLSPERISRRRLGITIGWLSFFVALVLAVVGVLTASPKNSMALLAFLGLVGGFVGVAVGAFIAQVVSPAKITKEHVWLKGVHRDYLAQLPAWSEA